VLILRGSKIGNFFRVKIVKIRQTLEMKFFPAFFLSCFVCQLVQAIPTNLAPGGTSTGSSQAYGSIFKDAHDDVRDGNFNNGSVWHTAIPDLAAYVEIDLGASYYLDRVMVWPRTDTNQGTVENFSIKVYDDAGLEVHTADYWPASFVNWAWGTNAMRGVRGRKVRYQKKDGTPNFLTFAELEIHGDVNPPTINYARAPGAVATASPAGFGTTIAAAVDGNLNANYANPASPRSIYHSAASGAGQFYQVDLGQDRSVDYLVLYSRQDSATTGDVRLSFRNASNVEVHTAVVNILHTNLVKSGARFDTTYDPPGSVTARTVRVETVSAQFLALGELEVFGPAADIAPPQVVRRYPLPDSLVAEFTTMDVDFSEAVTGVDAADFLANGVAAVSVQSVSPSQYVVTFAQPASGPVTLAIPVNSGITDVAGNALAPLSWTLTLNTSLPAPKPVISEILAVNQGGLKDEDGDSPDWIEIYNPGPTAINLGQWYLSDQSTLLTKWRFPSPTIVEAGQYLMVFASSKNRAAAGATLHTNFKLDPDGESVFLVKPDGTTVASQILNYPDQEPNVSFGTAQSYAATPALGAGTPVKYLVPTAAVPGWQDPAFADAAWTSGTLGVGFDVSNGQGAAGPLGWWNFNDASVATTTADASGNNRPGTVTNATYSADGLGRTGQPGDRAMEFAGNGVVTIPAAATGAFDAITARDAVTVSLWCFGAATMPVANYTFLGTTDPNGGGLRAFSAHLPWSDSVIYWDTASCCDANQHRVLISEPEPSQWRGQWNHYVFVKNGPVKQIWQNGFLILEGKSLAQMPNFRSFYIGAGSAAGGNGYQGRLDDFALWDGALLPSQIESLAAGASPSSVRLLTPAIQTDLAAAMHNVNATAYMRVPFQVSNAAATDLLQLRMRYDDGFVAYLNGVEVTRRNSPSLLAPNSTASSNRPGGEALVSENLDISRFASLLVNGTNVLAVQALNATAADPEFLVLPELYVGNSAPGRYFTNTTPEGANGTGYTGFVKDVKFFPQRGFYTAPVSVTITCSTPGATIVYTTDGSTPALGNGVQSTSPAVVNIAATTNLRATAFFGTLAPTNVDTHTYLFLSQVAGQQAPPIAPTVWPGGFAADFAMDARVPGATPAAGYSLVESLQSLPSLVLTCPPSDLWSANGIYYSSTGRGRQFERASSAEWFEAGSNTGFQIDAGLRIHGNISRQKNFTPKHGFSLAFRGEYGSTSLDYPLFPDSTVTKFDELVLRAGSTDTFPCIEWAAVGLGINGEQYQRWKRDWASYIRDQWVRDAHIAMGQPDFHGRYCHVYLNNTYWGLYNVTEAPGAPFMAEHFGGDEKQWDVMSDFNELRDGGRAAWDQLLNMANGGQLDTDAGLRNVQGLNADGTPSSTLPKLLNVDSLIDYMILSIYIGSDDWPNHNWWSARRTGFAGNDGYHFFTWDQEISNVNTAYGRSSWGPIYAEANADGTPTRVYFRMRNSPEFRLRFADRVQKFLFNDGALSPGRNLSRWNARRTEIDKAIVAESSRWGDAQANAANPGLPYTRENTWLPHLQWMEQNYWPNIPATALQRFRTANLYPAVNPPVLSQHGGLVPGAFNLTLTHPNATGDIYYTTDGSDPRLWGGNNAATAQLYTGSISLPANSRILARVKQGTTWSALTEARFRLNLDQDADGIADAWELAFGLSPNNAADALLDSDGDGQTNQQEYAANTDPQNASISALPMNFVFDSLDLLLEFTALPGRIYKVQRSDDMANWTTRGTWGPVATTTVVNYTETPEQPRHFYKVTVTALDPNSP
jgi:hypothetical protein